MKSKVLSLIMVISFLLVGCGDSTEETIAESSAPAEESVIIGTTNDGSADESESDNSQDITVLGNINPLTGLEGITDEAVGKRPVAIMVNNIRAALPQYGIEQADIIFEMPVEGYQTRLMALYADYTQIPKVCSVRSCRKYFPAMSEGFDAIYVNCGMANVIRSYVKSLDLTQYDGARYTKHGLFARDEERRNAGYAVEHTLYFDGTVFPTVLAEDGARLDIEEDKNNEAFLFNGIGEFVLPEGKSCSYAYIDFGANESGFTYDPDTKTYLKDFAGDVQIDGKTGNQLSFTNLFILETKISYDKDAVYNSNGDMHRYFDWHGGEDSIGYYISGGIIQEIYWIKENESSRLKFYDKDGNELSINRGKSYICFNDVGGAEFTE